MTYEVGPTRKRGNSLTLETLRSACESPLPSPSPELLRHAGHQVMDWMIDDHVNRGHRGVGTTASRPEMEQLLREPPPEDGIAFEQLLADFHENIVAHALCPDHPRFLAFIASAPTFASVLGDCLAGAANLFAGVWFEAAAAAQVEILVLDWFKQFLGYPDSAIGLLTGGGSEANLTAFITAREKLPYAERPHAVLYASEHRHWSIDRAAKIIGLRAEQIRSVPCDADFRLRPDALDQAITADQRAGLRPWLILANAGTTNTGSVDPLADLADLRDRAGLWLHVDAAYGWPMSLTREGQAVLHGIARADSITLDPHKWFAQTFDVGCLLVRQGELLTQTFMMRPEYMQDVVPGHDEINFCDHGIALTRRFRALKIWFSIKLLGIAWFRRLIEHGCALAEFAQALLASRPCFEITSPRKLSIVCFRYVPTPSTATPEQSDALQQAIAEDLARSERAFLSTTRLHGLTTLRFCFVNWRTTAADVEAIIALIEDIATRYK